MKKTFGIVTLFFLLVSSLGAEYNFDGSTNVVGSGEIMTTSAPITTTSAKVYKTSEEFLKAEGETCTFATDGCNSHTIQDGKLGASTEKYCEDIYGKNGQEKWSCLKYKEEPKVYKTSEEFLKAEGNKCETATDGCNTVMIVDGKLGGMTKMYCEDIYGPNGQEEWSCLKYKSENDMKVCTMDYRPVCGVDGNTYGNACMAGDVEVLYKGECSTYVDVAAFNILLKKEKELQKSLANVKTEVLEKASENIDNMIEGVKLSKIAAWGQKLKITQYTFIKRLIQNELDIR